MYIDMGFIGKRRRNNIVEDIEDFRIYEAKEPICDIEEEYEYESLREIRGEKDCLSIGYAAEMEDGSSSERKILSWDFAVIKDGYLFKYRFVPEGVGRRLKLKEALAYILSSLDYKSHYNKDIVKYRYCKGFDEDGRELTGCTKNLEKAKEKGKYLFDYKTRKFIDESCDLSKGDINYEKTSKFSMDQKISVCLISFGGKEHFSALDIDRCILRDLVEIQGGIISLQPINVNAPDLKRVNSSAVFPVSLTFTDTLCHTPGDKKRLEDIKTLIADKSGELNEDMQISVISLLYISRIYGRNKIPPCTLTSASAKVIKKKLMSYFGVKSIKEFNLKWKGTEKVVSDREIEGEEDRYYQQSSFEPINDMASRLQEYCKKAYFGGYNMCSEVGYFDKITYDYDLANAYPTSMMKIPDIDWDNAIKKTITDRWLTLSDFEGDPFLPMMVYCTKFEFPESVQYPCIPIKRDGTLVYPQTSEGLKGVYIAGPAVYLALKLGAKVYCQTGYIANCLSSEHSCGSGSLAEVIKNLVKDRNLAEQKHGKGSIEEEILKAMSTSAYGKIAQGINLKGKSGKNSFFVNRIEESGITNSFAAAMITSVVQSEIIAGANQISEKKQDVYSATTDGFITNISYEELQTLDLYGIKSEIEKARLILTEGKDKELWKKKHEQNDLLNFTTRGNVSLSSEGVCAHNSAKSGYKEDSYEDRLWLTTQVLDRKGRVKVNEIKEISFKSMFKKRKDYSLFEHNRRISMDFDLKREPLFDEIYTDHITIGDKTYEIAHVKTKPFKSVNEFMKYRNTKRKIKVLRTQKDWKKFFVFLQGSYRL